MLKSDIEKSDRTVAFFLIYNVVLYIMLFLLTVRG